MVLLIAFVGLLAFLPGYLSSIENRFQRDGKFCPFALRANLRASPEARKVLTWFGLAIWAVAVAAYLFGPELIVSYRDRVLLLSGAVIVFFFMLMGRCRELAFEKTSAASPMQEQWRDFGRAERRQVVGRAARDVAKVLVFVAMLRALKAIVLMLGC